jgi:hypothetical protein
VRYEQLPSVKRNITITTSFGTISKVLVVNVGVALKFTKVTIVKDDGAAIKKYANFLPACQGQSRCNM